MTIIISVYEVKSIAAHKGFALEEDELYSATRDAFPDDFERLGWHIIDTPDELEAAMDEIASEIPELEEAEEA